MLTHELKLEQAQRQMLSREQRYSLEILQCSNFQLHQCLREAYFENPMLEYENAFENQSFDSWSEFSGKKQTVEYEILFSDGSNRRREEVIEQLKFLKYSKKEWEILNFMIEALENTGYLTVNASEIAKECFCTQEEAEKCLEILQNIEPAGIFQENLKNSLLFQLSKGEYKSEQLEHIILYHLEDIAAGKISKIAKEMKISLTEVQKYINQLRNFNFHLLMNWDLEKPHYIIPDIIATFNRGRWEVELNDRWMGRYIINTYYEKMMEEKEDKELYQYFSLKLKQAKQLLFQVELRRKTVIQITKQILQKQEDFFKYNGLLRPASLSQIAEAVEKHPSTVSRAIRNKYLQTPKGIFLLKDLLIRKGNYKKRINKIDDKILHKQVEAGQIKKEISELIKAENKKKPYSDQMITNKLREKGFEISRRTVTQYREQMGIWSSYDRRGE